MTDQPHPSEKYAGSLTRSSVPVQLLKLALPMLGGTFAMTTFNLVDTYYISRLPGPEPLAAMGFTFPVIMVLVAVAHGIGMGVTSVVSRILGAGEHKKAALITAHSILLALILVISLAAVGLCTIRPVFTMLGAEADMIPLIREYIVIWYGGIVFMIVPMMINNVMRAAGNAVIPGIIMVAACILNAVLDPIMIFGFAGFPALGLRGAALATVTSRAVTLIAGVWILHSRFRLIDFRRVPLGSVWDSWERVLHIGIPSVMTGLLMPISGGVITRLVAGFGVKAVAACSAAVRIEMFAFMVPMALGISQVPFIGQNWGAGRLDRVNRCRTYSNLFAFGWGIVIAILFRAVSGPLAGIFSDDPEVFRILKMYLCTVPIGYGMMEIHRYVGFSFNAIGRPMHAVCVNVLRIVFLLIPLSILGANLFGLQGIFWGRVITDILSASAALVWASLLFRSIEYRGFIPHAARCAQ